MTGPLPGPVIDPELFDGLDAGLPLALLPVRLTARYVRGGGPGTPPTELLVRIHPDVIHADAHDPALTETEEELGWAYWERIWRAAGSAPRIADARAGLAAQLDPYRAVWVAAALTPENPADAPRRPLRGGTPLPVAPAFPAVARRGAPRPSIARLLPDRWVLIGYVNAEEAGRWWSAEIAPDLAMAPNLASLEAGDGVREFLTRQGLHWMVDFDAAVTAGMAVRIPLDAQTRHGFNELIAVGVRGDRFTGAAELGELLTAHRYTSGLDFVPQGAPTNTTETVTSAVSTDTPDLAALFASETAAPAAPAGPAALFAAGAASVAAAALGLADTGALGQAEHAALADAPHARAMNVALWPSTVAALFTDPLAPAGGAVVRGAHLRWLRDWFRDVVRGGGVLPALRIGEQPYALLPVTPMPYGAQQPPPVTERDWLEQTLAALEIWWAGSVAAVATLSPVAGAAAPGGDAAEEAVNVASVLGATPHPTRLRLRPAVDHFEDMRDAWGLLLILFEGGMLSLDAEDSNVALSRFHAREADIRGAQGLGVQIAALRFLRADYENLGSGDPWPDLIAFIDELLLPPLEQHDERAGLAQDVPGFPPAGAFTSEDDPRLWYVLYEDAGPDVLDTALAVVGDDPRATLRALSRDARRATPPEYDETVPVPLVERLLQRSITLAEPAARPELADAIATLAELGSDELDRLTRETLGLATHRLDAWHASVAADRLAQKRAARPSGLQVGGYGWLLNLVPDAGASDTQGFIHAPSLAHAATAAVLRSAWSAFSTDARSAAFAVDLSSERVRRASWILDGVRGGQRLEDLLGARFERRLHDHGLDVYIEDVRTAVLAGQAADAPPGAIVDGLALAVAYADLATPPAGDLVRTRVDADVLAGAGADAGPLHTQLHGASVDLDAVSDLLTAQAVHFLLAGNLAEADAAAAATGTGDSGVPAARVADVHRETELVTHRVLAVFGAAGAPGGTLLDLIEPAVCAWAGELVGRLADVACDVAFLDSDGAQLGTAQVALHELGLAPAQLVTLAPAGDHAEGSRLGALVAGWARRFVPGGATAARVTVETRRLAVRHAAHRPRRRAPGARALPAPGRRGSRRGGGSGRHRPGDPVPDGRAAAG